MTYIENATDLPLPRQTVIMRPGAGAMLLVMLCLVTQGAFAQQKSAPKTDELDVTMQVIVDPDAKLPDEVVRRIPLPAPKPAVQPAANATDGKKPDAAIKSEDRAREAREMGRETSNAAKERAKDAAEQREQARRAEDERRRNPPKPPRPHPPRP
jgi:hypothetical protein